MWLAIKSIFREAVQGTTLEAAARLVINNGPYEFMSPANHQ